ncbi:MAG: sulfatase-like hydrolase/transferase [Lentisphaeraceae bacterium]|nr:sulfatase-like hydrolase/transferase [Lentisphaeraceae bacterium]
MSSAKPYKLICLFIFLSAWCFAEERKPNVIFIFADDIGYEALPSYGGLDFETPNLDIMAKGGMRFERMYTSPICTPSRVSMHTGLYTFRHKHMGVLPVHLGTKDKVDFKSMPTFAQQIRENGYQTSVTGKWQLATLEEWPNHIKNAGFDTWCIWQIWSEGKKMPRHWNPCLNKNGKIMEGLEKKFGPDVMVDFVLDEMESATKAKKPFFILHNELLPHWPVVDTPDDRKMKQTSSLKGMISYMDKLVGRIMKKVDDLGIRDNTYVVFMGDNGTWEKDFKNPKFGQKGERKHTRHTIHGNVNGGKAKLCDGGSHVPFLVWGPKQVPAGSVNSELIDVVDLFPTFCELTGTKVSKDLAVDGRSISNQIHGKKGPAREWTHQGLRNDQNIFDGSWRLFLKTGALWDARKLPMERVVKKAELVERKAVLKKLKAISESIKSNPPKAPEPINSY